MSKKKKKKQPAKAKRPSKPPQPSLGRYYRHHKKKIRKIGTWVGIGLAALVVISVAFVLVRKYGVSRTKADFVREARREFLLGQFDRALVSYHQAQNADPSDQAVERETMLAQRRAEIENGGSIEQTIGAAMQVASADSTSVLANAVLAQLHYSSGNLPLAYSYAKTALRLAEQGSDTTGQLSASLSLLAYFRQKDQFDSAAVYGEKAIGLAEGIGDAVNLSFAEAGTGFTLSRLGNLDKAKSLFQKISSRGGNPPQYLVDLASVGLADNFYRAKSYDSALYYASNVEGRHQGSTQTENSALAIQIHGNVLRDRGDLAAALAKLTASLDAWQSLKELAQVIDNLNDLAATYYLQMDSFNARKYYAAAGKLASKYAFPTKDLYNADMNLQFLKNLSSADYLRAGDEGTAIAQKYSFR
jgi:hypothetical protein